MDTEPLLKTYAVPYKYGKAIIEGSGVEGAFDSVCVGMPFMFRHNGKNFMLYTGFDGIGYQSALAVSDDLLHWQHYGMVLERTGIKGKWDSIQTCGTWILRDEELYGTYKPKKFQGKYWMIYHSYPEAGVEEGPGVMGMAWTEDENLLDWHRLDEPIFSWRDGADWEKGGLYKASLVQKDDTFYAFYNAKNQTTGSWIEQTGVVTSKDLVHWERYKENPVIRVKPDSWRSKFVSDP
ncbi:MAG: hypothetical protein LBQ88_17380, partial [Treponema sp.]|nr:hypothetical protein [Treponema sp.]